MNYIENRTTNLCEECKKSSGMCFKCLEKVDICPVHETKLTDGFCELCQTCYSCK